MSFEMEKLSRAVADIELRKIAEGDFSSTGPYKPGESFAHEKAEGPAHEKAETKEEEEEEEEGEDKD